VESVIYSFTLCHGASDVINNVMTDPRNHALDGAQIHRCEWADKRALHTAVDCLHLTVFEATEMN